MQTDLYISTHFKFSNIFRKIGLFR